MNSASTIADACRTAFEHRLVRGSSGNVSWKHGDVFTVTVSGSWFGEKVDCVPVPLNTKFGHVWDGTVPSIEWPLHAEIYKTRPDVGAILHFQATYATALACCFFTAYGKLDIIPEFSYYIKKCGLCPYFKPGSSKLAKEAASCFQPVEVSVVQMANHGQIAVGATLDEAVKRAIFFEFACELYMKIKESGFVPLVIEGDPEYVA